MRFLLAAAVLSMGREGSPSTRFATSNDGTRLAFDVTGSGPAVMLLHGGGQTRKSWHDAGYVARLAKARRYMRDVY